MLLEVIKNDTYASILEGFAKILQCLILGRKKIENLTQEIFLSKNKQLQFLTHFHFPNTQKK